MSTFKQKLYYIIIVGTVMGIIGLFLSLTVNAYGLSLLFIIGLSFAIYGLHVFRTVLSEENRRDYRD